MSLTTSRSSNAGSSDFGDVLREVDTYLTHGTQKGVDHAARRRDLAGVRDGLAELRVTVLATFADLPRPPYEEVVDAFGALSDGLEAMLGHLPHPGPRTALRLYRQHEVARRAELIGYGIEVLDAAVQWAGVACEAAP